MHQLDKTFTPVNPHFPNRGQPYCLASFVFFTRTDPSICISTCWRWTQNLLHGTKKKNLILLWHSYRKFPVLWNKLQYIISLVLWKKLEKFPFSKEQTTSISLFSAFIRILFYTICWRNFLIFWKKQRNIFVLWNQLEELPSNCKQSKGMNLILLSECIVHLNFSIIPLSRPTGPCVLFPLNLPNNIFQKLLNTSKCFGFRPLHTPWLNTP